MSAPRLLPGLYGIATVREAKPELRNAWDSFVLYISDVPVVVQYPHDLYGSGGVKESHVDKDIAILRTILFGQSVDS